VLDVGCGSAVLSILSAKLGAAHVFGVDTDEEAVRVSQENVVNNGVSDRVAIARGSYDLAQGIYDVVVANILAGVIVKMLNGGLAKLGRQFILSGILDTQVPQVSEAVTQAGLSLVERKQITDWVCLVCRSNS
jgi:ribosomal protein L11 methyltransferase